MGSSVEIAYPKKASRSNYQIDAITVYPYSALNYHCNRIKKLSRFVYICPLKDLINTALFQLCFHCFSPFVPEHSEYTFILPKSTPEIKKKVAFRPLFQLTKNIYIFILKTVHSALYTSLRTLPVQLARLRQPHGTREGSLSAARFPS